MDILKGAVAAERLKRDPSSVVFPIALFLTQFGLTEAEFRQEAAAGRLVVCGERGAPGSKIVFRNVHVTAAHLLLWMAHPETPKELLRRVDQFAFKSKAQQ